MFLTARVPTSSATARGAVVGRPLLHESSRQAPNLSTEGLSLRTNFAWILAGNLVLGACQWGVLAVLARLGGAAMSGQYYFGLTVVGPVMMFSGLQLRSLLVTDARGEARFGHYLAIRIATCVLSVLGIVLLSIVLGFAWSTLLVVAAVGLAKAIESMADIVHGLMQHHERMDTIGRSLMFRGALGLLAAVLGVVLLRSALGAVVGLVIAWMIVLWFYDRPRAAGLLAQTDGLLGRAVQAHPGLGESSKNLSMSCKTVSSVTLRPVWEASVAKSLVLRAAPLGVVMMLVSLNASLASYFIKPQLGEVALGVFGGMALITLFGSRIVLALGQAASPRLAAHHVDGHRAAFRKLLLKLILIAGMLGVCGILAAALVGGPLLSLLYGEEFATHANVFVWLMLAAAIGYVGSMFGYAATATRRVAGQPIVLIAVVATTFVGCWAWVPGWGLLGAAWASVAGAVVNLIGFGAILLIFDTKILGVDR